MFFSRSLRKASSHDEGDAPPARPTTMSESMPNINNSDNKNTDQFEIVNHKLPYSFDEDKPQDAKPSAAPSVQQREPSSLSPPHHLHGGTSVPVDSPISFTSMKADDVPDSILQDLPSSDDAEDAAAQERIATPPRVPRKHAASPIQAETVYSDDEGDDDDDDDEDLVPSLLKMASKKQQASTKRLAGPRSETEAASSVQEEHSPDPKKARTTQEATFHNNSSSSGGALLQPQQPPSVVPQLAAETLLRTIQSASHNNSNNNQPPPRPAPAAVQAGNPPPPAPSAGQPDAIPNHAESTPKMQTMYRLKIASVALLLALGFLTTVKGPDELALLTKKMTAAFRGVAKPNSSIVIEPHEPVSTEVVEPSPEIEVVIHDSADPPVVPESNPLNGGGGAVHTIAPGSTEPAGNSEATVFKNETFFSKSAPKPEGAPSEAPVLDNLAEHLEDVSSFVVSAVGSGSDLAKTKMLTWYLGNWMSPPWAEPTPVQDPTPVEEPTPAPQPEDETPSPPSGDGPGLGMRYVAAACFTLLFLGMMKLTEKPDDDAAEFLPDVNKVEELCNYLRVCDNALSRTGRRPRAAPVAWTRMGYDVSAYEGLTKDELHNIGNQLGVADLSSSDNKATLIQKIVPAYAALLQGFVMSEIKQVLAAKNVQTTWKHKKADLVQLAVEAAF